MPYFNDIDPVAVHIGPLAVHWYGLMYLAAFGVWYWLSARRIAAGRLAISPQAFSDLAFYGMLGVILGGRLGYTLFYGFGQWLDDPVSIFRVWEGGMSFHGGLLGVLVATALWSRKHGVAFWDMVDFVAPMVPPGLGFGRLGNFIGGELWGRHTDAAWGVIFPKALDHLGLSHEAMLAAYRAGELNAEARHPSQLYQAVLEGLVMFVVLYWYSSKPRPRYAVSGLFALLYGTFRFLVEFVREPDQHLGYLAFGWLTMGQVLSLPIIATGLVLFWLSRSAPTVTVAQPKAVLN